MLKDGVLDPRLFIVRWNCLYFVKLTLSSFPRLCCLNYIAASLALKVDSSPRLFLSHLLFITPPLRSRRTKQFLHSLQHPDLIPEKTKTKTKRKQKQNNNIPDAACRWAWGRGGEWFGWHSQHLIGTFIIISVSVATQLAQWRECVCRLASHFKEQRNCPTNSAE